MSKVKIEKKIVGYSVKRTDDKNAEAPRPEFRRETTDGVVAIDDDVTEVDTDPQLDAAVLRHVLIAPYECSLDLDRAFSGIHRARKFDQHAVTGGLDDATVVLGDARIEHLFAERLELRQRARLVLAHEPAVTDHVGRQDRR